MEKVGPLLNGTTSPDVVNAGWFTSQYRVMLALAVIVALPILLVSVAQAIVRADAMQAIRSAFVYLPLAAILSFVGPVNPGVPVFGVLIASMLVVLGAISIWLELLLRSAAIYIAVLFLPLGLAAMIWPAGLRWCKRLIEFLIAIIFAKVFIVAIINLAAAGLAKGGFADKFEGVLAGGALLLMAAFT